MFHTYVYIQRREQLKKTLDSGIALFLGNDESPMNFTANTYPFRQDSTFLYYFGLDKPGLDAVIDIDEGETILFGDELPLNDRIWTGPLPALKDQSEKAGVKDVRRKEKFEDYLENALRQNRTIHFLPQYRPENKIKIHQLLKINIDDVEDNTSIAFINAVVKQRSVKGQEEIEQIELALKTTHFMHLAGIVMSKSDSDERSVASSLIDTLQSKGLLPPYPPIVTIHGEILHNPHYKNKFKPGDLVLIDAGAESPLHYATDITRTSPVSKKFSRKQKEIYTIVLNAQLEAIETIKPGVEYRDVHRIASRVLVSGLKDIGLIKGDVDEAVEAGAHTLFFPHGIGHMLGLDVHDMEALGEDYVGYTETIKRRSDFGWSSLRLAKTLEPGFVVTVEPGIYFIPDLIDLWKSDHKLADFINYDKVEKYRDFGGIRIEDNVLVEEHNGRVLGKPIPKTIQEIEKYNAIGE